MPRIGSRKSARNPYGSTPDPATGEAEMTLVQPDTGEKRKRAASPSSDTEENPLSLRGFQTPMASRVKESTDGKADIPTTKAVTKPPAKKMRAQSAQVSEEIPSLDALEMALGTPTSTPPSGTSGNPIEFESDGEKERPSRPQRAVAIAFRETQAAKKRKNRDAIEAAQKEAKKAKKEAKEQRKAETTADTEAAAKAKADLKKQRKANAKAAAKIKEELKKQKKNALILGMRRIVQQWPREKLVTHVHGVLRHLAVEKLRESQDLALVEEGLALALKAVHEEQKAMDEAGPDNEEADVVARQTQEREQKMALEQARKQEVTARLAAEKQEKKANKQVKQAPKQQAPGSKKARKQEVQRAKEAEKARKNAPPPRPEDVEAEAKIIEKELEELSKKIKKEKVDGDSSKKIKQEKIDTPRIKKEVIVKQESRE